MAITQIPTLSTEIATPGPGTAVRFLRADGPDGRLPVDFERRFGGRTRVVAVVAAASGENVARLLADQRPFVMMEVKEHGIEKGRDPLEAHRHIRRDRVTHATLRTGGGDDQARGSRRHDRVKGRKPFGRHAIIV